MMFITEKVPSSLRGELTKWMLQLKPGVFIGTLSALVGEKLWQKIQENQCDGGAIWVKASNNEQRFKLTTSGNPHWTIRDFDGLQLITNPHKTTIKKHAHPKKRAVQSSNKTANNVKRRSTVDSKIPRVTWNTENTPRDLITRKAVFKSYDSNVNVSFSGTSAHGEYPPEILWQKPWIEDIRNIGSSILSHIRSLKNLSEQSFYGKKLLCIDIETTDYLPKAFEGFINIIGSPKVT